MDFMRAMLTKASSICTRFFMNPNDANCMLRMLVVFVFWSALTHAAAADVPVRNESLRNEISRAIDRGADWLLKNQNAEGWWSTTDQPAVTALSLVALNPQSEIRNPKLSTTFDKGYSFLAKYIQP